MSSTIEVSELSELESEQIQHIAKELNIPADQIRRELEWQWKRSVPILYRQTLEQLEAKIRERRQAHHRWP